MWHSFRVSVDFVYEIAFIFGAFGGLPWLIKRLGKYANLWAGIPGRVDSVEGDVKEIKTDVSELKTDVAELRRETARQTPMIQEVADAVKTDNGKPRIQT